MYRKSFIKKIEELTDREIDTKQLERWKFPPKYLTWNWEKLGKIQIKFFDFIYPFIENFPNNSPHSLYIHSSHVGMGKTVLSTVIAKTLFGMKKKIKGKVFFISYGRFIDMCREGSEDSVEIFKNIEIAKLVVIDDVGKEYSTKWSTSKLYTILNERDNSILPMIITSNFSIDEFIKRLRRNTEVDSILIDSIESRLKGMCTQINLHLFVEIKDNRLRNL
jgi:DNA replication protein DnaC